MPTKTLQFYDQFAPLILSGQKKATLRQDAKGLFAGNVVHLMDQKGQAFAVAKVVRFYGAEIYEDGIGHLGGNHERTIRLLQLECLDWESLVGFVREQYGLPFSGVVIEFELI